MWLSKLHLYAIHTLCNVPCRAATAHKAVRVMKRLTKHSRVWRRQYDEGSLPALAALLPACAWEKCLHGKCFFLFKSHFLLDANHTKKRS